MKTSTTRWATVGSLAVLALLGGACGGGDDTKTVTAVDYRYEDLPKTVKAGTTLTLKNESAKELHEMVIIRLPDNEKRSVDELAKLPESELEGLFTGPPAAVLIRPPGDAAEIKALGDGKLTEKGRYVVFCAVPTGADPAEYLKAAEAAQGGPPQVAGGPPHLTQGMYGEITVN